MTNKAGHQAKIFLFDGQMEDSNINAVKLNSFLAQMIRR